MGKLSFHPLALKILSLFMFYRGLTLTYLGVYIFGVLFCLIFSEFSGSVVWCVFHFGILSAIFLPFLGCSLPNIFLEAPMHGNWFFCLCETGRLEGRRARGVPSSPSGIRLQKVFSLRGQECVWRRVCAHFTAIALSFPHQTRKEVFLVVFLVVKPMKLW